MIIYYICVIFNSIFSQYFQISYLIPCRQLQLNCLRIMFCMSLYYFAAIDYVGGIPFAILKPVLEKCTAKQLYDLEVYNPVSAFIYLTDCITRVV